MTNDQIVKWFHSFAGVEQSSDRERAAYQILQWVLSVGGPIAIADAAAWELVTSECYAEQVDGFTWWRTQPDQLPLPIDEGDDTPEQISRALRYLHSREKLIGHAAQPSFVRWAE